MWILKCMFKFVHFNEFCDELRLWQTLFCVYFSNQLIYINFQTDTNSEYIPDNMTKLSKRS